MAPKIPIKRNLFPDNPYIQSEVEVSQTQIEQKIEASENSNSMNPPKNQNGINESSKTGSSKEETKKIIELDKATNIKNYNDINDFHRNINIDNLNNFSNLNKHNESNNLNEKTESKLEENKIDKLSLSFDPPSKVQIDYAKESNQGKKEETDLLNKININNNVNKKNPNINIDTTSAELFFDNFGKEEKYQQNTPLNENNNLDSMIKEEFRNANESQINLVANQFIKEQNKDCSTIQQIKDKGFDNTFSFNPIVINNDDPNIKSGDNQKNNSQDTKNNDSSQDLTQKTQEDTSPHFLREETIKELRTFPPISKNENLLKKCTNISFENKSIDINEESKNSNINIDFNINIKSDPIYQNNNPLQDLELKEQKLQSNEENESNEENVSGYNLFNNLSQKDGNITESSNVKNANLINPFSEEEKTEPVNINININSISSDSNFNNPNSNNNPFENMNNDIREIESKFAIQINSENINNNNNNITFQKDNSNLDVYQNINDLHSQKKEKEKENSLLEQFTNRKALPNPPEKIIGNEFSYFQSNIEAKDGISKDHEIMNKKINTNMKIVSKSHNQINKMKEYFRRLQVSENEEIEKQAKINKEINELFQKEKQISDQIIKMKSTITSVDEEYINLLFNPNREENNELKINQYENKQQFEHLNLELVTISNENKFISSEIKRKKQKLQENTNIMMKCYNTLNEKINKFHFHPTKVKDSVFSNIKKSEEQKLLYDNNTSKINELEKQIITIKKESIELESTGIRGIKDSNEKKELIEYSLNELIEERAQFEKENNDLKEYISNNKSKCLMEDKSYSLSFRQNDALDIIPKNSKITKIIKISEKNPSTSSYFSENKEISNTQMNQQPEGSNFFESQILKPGESISKNNEVMKETLNLKDKKDIKINNNNEIQKEEQKFSSSKPKKVEYDNNPIDFFNSLKGNVEKEKAPKKVITNQEITFDIPKEAKKINLNMGIHKASKTNKDMNQKSDQSNNKQGILNQRFKAELPSKNESQSTSTWFD